MALVPIHILGSKFSLRSDDQDPQNLERIVELFQKKVKEIQESVGVMDPLKIAILTGIILSEELSKEKLKNTPTLRPHNSVEFEEMERITKTLIHSIEEVL